MPRLVRQYDLPLFAEARHVVFAGDDALMFTTTTADVWKMAASPTAARPELLFPGRLVLAPVVQVLGQAAVVPASGGYPRLAVSFEADSVVVNTHDLVLVACRLNGDEQRRLLSYSWGEYYPRFEFSSDNSRFAAKADRLLVFDTRSWDGHTLNSVEVCGWHPQQPKQLCVDYEGELFWADWSQGITPEIQQLGTIGLRNGWNQAHGLVVLEGGERFVVAFHPPRIELWRLNPLQLIESLETSDGEISDLRLSPKGKWLVVLSESGVRVWDTETHFELSDLFPGISELDLAPSGQRFVTHHLTAGTNPYPTDRTTDRPAGGDLASCWEISE